MASSFGFIIVGGGSAGCVLASRLSEDSALSVLLLEAGGPDTKSEIKVPAAFSKLFKSDLDWAYFTQEQRHLANRRLFWPRGRVLGGSSAINAMIYIRGNPLDYDHWRDLGCEGWGFSDLLKYFKRSEDQERIGSKFHQAGGPLRVADLRTINPLSQAFVNAGREMGLSRCEDFNGLHQDGIGFYQVNQLRGQRHSAAAAFLRPAMRRPNLKIECHAHATRILLKNEQAIGIEYLQNNKLHQAYAESEVILCGGAIGSPQLLMLSALGQQSNLASSGFP